MRGAPTIASIYIREQLGLSRDYLKDMEKVAFLSDENLNWTRTIKGDVSRNDFPAHQFYNDLPEILKSVGFIRNLIIAECPIHDILPEVNGAFHRQQVDFYIPLLRTVIEVDGSSHQVHQQKKHDKQRDNLFSRNRIKVIRILTHEIRMRNYEPFKQQFRKVYMDHKETINVYKKYLSISPEQIETQVQLSSIVRIQILILELLDRGVLSLEDRTWRLNIRAHDAESFLEIAIIDLEKWLGNIAALLDIKIEFPEIQIKVFDNANDLPIDQEQINIDFDIFKRWDETVHQKNVYFIRTDFDDNANYFSVKINESVTYKLRKEFHEKQLKFLLENIFGHKEFRDGQLEIIINSLNGEDTVGLLPTGGGKSLTYQLCTLLHPAISYVVAPIKSLMADQIENAKTRHYISHVAFINSDLSPGEAESILNDFSKGKYIFLIISPERFQIKKFREELEIINRSKAIAIATIDEVHCLSEWGHDFRTAYLSLANTIRRYTPSARFLALTATASSKVLKDVMTELGIEPYNIITISDFKRPELLFDIRNVPRNKKTEQLIEILGENKKIEGPTVVFTPLVNRNTGCYELSLAVKNKTGMKSNFYSGSKPKKFEVANFNKYKDEIQRSFMNDEIDVLVATKAFGMGVDKSNIRRTIHYGIPNSLESFYQEAGRAGRDRESSECIILYSPDRLDSESEVVIFGMATDVERMILHERKLSGDLTTSLFFLRNSLMNIESEIVALCKFFEGYLLNAGNTILIPFKSESEMGMIERSIYRFTLIGITLDWTIDWNKRLIEVEIEDWTEEIVLNALEAHIQKYDFNFSITDESSTNELSKRFHESNEGIIKKALRVLLTWYNDNISYSRKRSLLLMKQYADEFTDSATMQDKLATYFKRNDDIFLLEKIVGDKKKIKDWYKIFFIQEEGKELQQRQLSSFKDLSIQCSRFLESENNNTALNLISGMLKLQQGNFESIDGKQRMESAIREISKLQNSVRKQMLVSILYTSKSYFDDEKRNELSRTLIDNGYDQMDDLKEIHLTLEDPTSYRCMIKALHTKLQGQKGVGYPWEI